MRSVWRVYGGWYDLDPADLKPARTSELAQEIAALAGGASELARRARELGLDIATIRRVLDHEVSIAEVAGVHAEALDVQIRTLRLRRAVLRAVAKRGSSPEEMRLMHKVAKLSDAERRRIIYQFIDDAFGGLDANPDLVAMLRSVMLGAPRRPQPRAGRRLGGAGRAGPGPGLQDERPPDGRTPGRPNVPPASRPAPACATS